MTDRWNAALYIYTYIDYNYVVHWAKNKEYKKTSWAEQSHTRDVLWVFLLFPLEFVIWVGSNKWLLRYCTFKILRSSSIRGHLHLKDWQNMIWSYKLQFKIFVWSNQWLLRKTNFNILRSSSIVCLLHLKNLYKIV